MPIPGSDKPPETRAAAYDANRRGIELHAQGRVADAVDAFRTGVALDPRSAELQTNLGTALMQLGRIDEARGVYERVLALDPADVGAHLAMYELEQMAGNAPAAIAHQRSALERQTIFTRRAPQERRSVLALMAPGDWQANVPIDFLIDPQTTTVHKAYLLSPERIASADLPRADVVFTAIGESDENEPLLRAAQALVERLGLPAVNRPLNILRTNRVRLWEKLGKSNALSVPMTQRLTRAEIENSGLREGLPAVIRPVGSHAGHGLERIQTAGELRAYLDRISASEYFVMPFVDFSKDDGYYRKYRIIVVDGVPYAYHLAISPNWMIHYYNAPMRENAWMREEEREFLSGFDRVFDDKQRAALAELARALDLEYFGVDCSIDRDGRVLVFEADPAMIVHAADDPALFGYKIPAAQRIFTAFERLLDRARSG